MDEIKNPNGLRLRYLILVAAKSAKCRVVSLFKPAP